jgi:peptidoglycan hydrolase FlgJ
LNVGEDMRIENINLPISQEIKKPSIVEDGNFQDVLDNAVNKKDTKKLLEVCQQFESFFINKMFQQMRAAIPKGSLSQEDPGRELAQSMLDDEYSVQMAKAGGFGLAQILYTQLSGENNVKPKIDEKR